MDCLQIYRELSNLQTLLPVHSNSKEVSNLSWQKTYPNLKTTCHIKLQFLVNVTPTELTLYSLYLMSVPVPLTSEV